MYEANECMKVDKWAHGIMHARNEPRHNARGRQGIMHLCMNPGIMQPGNEEALWRNLEKSHVAMTERSPHTKRKGLKRNIESGGKNLMNETHQVSDTRCRVETRRKLLLQNKRVGRLLQPAAFREVATESELVWRARLLGLDVDNERRRQEWPSEDAFSLFTSEGAGHPAAGDL